MRVELGSEWQIPSNSGREIISGKLTSINEFANDRILVFDVICHASAFGEHGSGELVEKYRLSFHQIAIGQKRLTANVTELYAWLQIPKPLELEFSASPTKVFNLSFGVRGDVISSMERPVCILRHGSFLTRCEVGFVVDQSCIQILQESLSAFCEETRPDIEVVNTP